MRQIERNKILHEKLEPGRLEDEKYSVYHYRNMLYSYAFEMDSAQRYFDLMRDGNRLPHNNFATFNAVCGDFKKAEEEYKIASEQDAGDKRLQEWAYYTSILNIYKGKPKAGVELAKNMVKAAGTTPGYGWYNIAISRALLYDGQVANAEKYTDKASDFKELHIGTTLGQSHYEFSVQLLKLMSTQRETEMLLFENRNWWYNPKVLVKLVGSTTRKFMQQFLIINQFARNPERDRVIYKLFSNESTVSWDEIWHLVHDFSTRFFINKFSKEAATDKRIKIRKYFSYFVATLKMKQGNYKEAKIMLDELTRNEDTDPEYEKLFLARLYEAEAKCADKLHLKKECEKWMYQLYITYPQLAPFTGIPLNMNLVVSGTPEKKIVERLKGYNINFDSPSASAAPTAYLTFSGTGNKRTITYSVRNAQDKVVVPQQPFTWTTVEGAAKHLAYGLFAVGGN
jgi:hypothetical protein